MGKLQAIPVDNILDISTKSLSLEINVSERKVYKNELISTSNLGS
jgi:hypothetical protein